MTNEQILKKAGISKKEYDAIHQWVNGYTLMTNEEILHKAIEKAEKKGYHTPFVWISDRGKEILKDMAREGNTSCYSIIFSHNFAKAFWGEGSAEEQYKKLDEYWHDTGCCSGSGCFFRGKNWQYHLQQMVLEKEPLKYIEKFL